MANIILRMLRFSQHPKLGNSRRPPPQPTTPAFGWLTLDVGLVLAFGVSLVTLVFAMVAGLPPTRLLHSHPRLSWS